MMSGYGTCGSITSAVIAKHGDLLVANQRTLISQSARAMLMVIDLLSEDRHVPCHEVREVRNGNFRKLFR